MISLTNAEPGCKVKYSNEFIKLFFFLSGGRIKEKLICLITQTSALVTSLYIVCVSSLEWNPKRLDHLFSLRPPLTYPTCVSLPSALLEKRRDLRLSAPPSP